ncbi:MAG: hypothetical protein NTU44_15925 [Bacteroidetes bacterium]|nr:hypothetical protein [Bacteroidota bacterium]
MKIDLNNGAFIQIGGELGKYNSLPIDSLIRIAQDLQELVYTLAKYDLPSDEPIDLNNFKIELTGFSKGSAVPKFAFSPRSENKSGFHWQEQRNSVNEKFEKLVEISDNGDYGKIIPLYPEPIIRNAIVTNLYSFVNSFGNSPANFVDLNESDNEITPIFKIKRFKPAVKSKLITEIIESVDNTKELEDAVGKIRITKAHGKTTRKIINTYSGKNYSLEFAPEVIASENRRYILKYPLRCLFEKEDNYYIIQSEMLGIIGTGRTEDEAEQSFSMEFDYLYERLKTLQTGQLTKHNQLIKNIINQVVENIEE